MKIGTKTSCEHCLVAIVTKIRELAAKAVQSPALSLEGIDHIHGSDSLPLGMFSVSDSVANHILKEHLQNSSSFFVDQSEKKEIRQIKYGQTHKFS